MSSCVSSGTSWLVLSVAIALLAACDREPLTMSSNGGATAIAAGGTTTIATGGTPAIPTGGTIPIPTGGASGASTGGIAGTATGGAIGAGASSSGGYPAGGAAGAAKGGAAGATLAFGGAAGAIRGGAGGRVGTGGAGGAGGTQSCSGVVCSPIPSSCKKLVQEPGACCPTCTDTGCGPCPALTCPTGTHQELLAGDCCPSCVTNPTDPCLQGKQDYATVRQQMFDKYTSSGCKNSSDCTLVLESNACAQVCNVALPTIMASSFPSNLRSVAATDCATCPVQAPITCDAMTPACVNGKCVAVSSP